MLNDGTHHDDDDNDDDDETLEFEDDDDDGTHDDETLEDADDHDVTPDEDDETHEISEKKKKTRIRSENTLPPPPSSYLSPSVKFAPCGLSSERSA